MSVTPRAHHSRLPPPRSKQAEAALLLLKKPCSNSTLLSKPSTSYARFPGSSREILARPPTTGVVGISELTTTPKPPVGALAPIRNRETGLLQFSRSKNKYDGRGIILPENEANISVDKLLAQWADKITKAEQEFEEEELAYEKARARLCTPNRAQLRALSPSPSARLLEKAKRIISQNDKLQPINRHHSFHKNR